MLADAGRSSEAIVALEICKPLLIANSNVAMRLSLMLARAYKAEGDFDAALDEVRCGRVHFPEDAVLACHEAELLIHRGEIAAAGACLIALIRPSQPDLTAHELRARSLLAEIWMELGRHEAAEELARAVTRIHAGYGPAWLVLAEALLAQDKASDVDAALARLDAIPGADDACSQIRAARHDRSVRLSRSLPPWGMTKPVQTTRRVARAEPIPWEVGRMTLPRVLG